MTIEEILAGESKNVEFKEKLPEKSIKYMKSVVAFSNGTGGKTFLELPIKPERLSVLTKKMRLRKWMPLSMLYQTAVNWQLSRIKSILEDNPRNSAITGFLINFNLSA